MTTSSFIDIGLFAAKGRRTQAFKKTKNSNNKTNKTKQQTNNCNNKTKQQTNKSAILQMWYATARPSCRNVRRTQGFLLQTCFRLRWGLLCYQVKTLSPARKMIRGPRESVFGTQCEQHLNKFQASCINLLSFFLFCPNLPVLPHFFFFVPFFLFCPIVSFFYQFFFFSHFTNIAGASQCSCCDCNFCKSPGSWFRVVTKNAPIHQLLQNCIAPCVYPLTLLVLFWSFYGAIASPSPYPCPSVSQ